MPHVPAETTDEAVRVILVLTSRFEDQRLEREREEEMRSLIDTAGCVVVGVEHQRLATPVGATYIGKGKMEDVRRAAVANRADEAIFDCQLSPSQERNLERHLGIQVVDYTALILHIFARGARTHQAKLAVELAQLEHNRSRLKRLWSHLDRIKAGTNMRGPGEKQLEVDRRLVNDRIRELRSKLTNIAARKERAIASRMDCFKVCLVGYTNAGKSSLMNALTDAGVLTEDKLFATLDTRTTRLDLPCRHQVVLSDTVGFIRELPHTLVASFHATLAEAIEADLLLHVVDASQPNIEEQVEAVEGVLAQIGADRVPALLVLNKADLPHSKTIVLAFKHRYKGVVVSAKDGTGLDDLRAAISTAADKAIHTVRVRFPVTDGRTDAFLRRSTTILDEAYEDEDMLLTIEADADLIAQLHDHPALTIEPHQERDERYRPHTL